MKDKIKLLTYKLESSFIITVIRHGLVVMIPFVLTGGIANALMNLPINSYQSLIDDTLFSHLLNTIYIGTFGLFSFAMLIALSTSYCMERNMTIDKTILYILVSIGAYGAQFYNTRGTYNIDMLDVKGCFFAIITALAACHLLERLQKIRLFNFREQTNGMERITALAINMLFPAMIVIFIFVFITQFLLNIFNVNSLYELMSNAMCSLFDNMHNEFAKGLLYTILLHLMWAFGLHGSHILEPVATTTFALGTSGDIFSKSFFDTYVVMGGCGTTICVLIAILVFLRKTRLRKIAELASFTVVFNLNEILTFGIPILLNPILFIPFMITPIFCYITAYAATYWGLVPQFSHSVVWSTPIFFNSYLATGSIRAVLLQIFMIAVGVGIYLPFLKINLRAQTKYTKEQISDIVKILQEKEELNENVDLLSQSNRIGQICRMLRHDLEDTIANKGLYLLIQPQVDNTGKCIGGEALLRWNHPVYGFIYPPLIIYLAKDGGLLEPLEKLIIEQTCSFINTIQTECGPEFKISMNITSKSLFWDIEEYIDKTMKKYNVSASQLWIEITEQDVLSNTAMVTNKLNNLKAKGHVLMIDDFGMGHTSILYLQSNYFGVVKLDGSLVRDIDKNRTNQQIIASVVELSNNLDVKVIAEFVENEQQRDKLLELGCKWYQGYLYGKPLPLDEFIEFMKKHNSNH